MKVGPSSQTMKNCHFSWSNFMDHGVNWPLVKIETTRACDCSPYSQQGMQLLVSHGHMVSMAWVGKGSHPIDALPMGIYGPRFHSTLTLPLLRGGPQLLNNCCHLKTEVS